MALARDGWRPLKPHSRRRLACFLLHKETESGLLTQGTPRMVLLALMLRHCGGVAQFPQSPDNQANYITIIELCQAIMPFAEQMPLRPARWITPHSPVPSVAP